MRALPPPPPLLLLLLLGGVSSQDDSVFTEVRTKPGGDAQPVSTIATSTAQTINSKSNAGSSASVSPQVSPPSVSPPTTSQGVMLETDKGSPTSKPTTPPNTSSATSSSDTPEKVLYGPVVSSSTAQMTSLTNTPRKPSSIPTLSPSPTPGISPTSKPGDPPPIPVPSPSAKPSAGSGPLVSTTTVLSSVVQHQNSLSGSSGTSQTTPAATSPRAAPGIHPLERLPSTAASTTTPADSLSPDLKDHVSSTKSVSQQPHSSPSSEVQGPASSPRPASVSTSAAPSAGSVSPTTSKASQSLTPGSIDKVSLPATTLTSGAGQTSHGQGSTPTEPAIADQSPTSTQTLSPTSSHQMTSSRPGPQHRNDTFQNEVICEDQMQDSWPIIILKEAKTCAEWKSLTHNGSLFKTFCSTDRYSYEPSRDTCTVTLASAEPRSQRWAVWVVVHLHLDPEKVFKELKEKRHELEELGITNVTFHNEQQDEEIKDRFSTPLIITIITLAGSLLLVAAIYGCCHQRFSRKKDQQRLTEELQTMENGYHDNPTLEVMETSSEMQEKKVNLNGELGDSWIVPLDTLLKDELEEEEDTHL